MKIIFIFYIAYLTTGFFLLLGQTTETIKISICPSPEPQYLEDKLHYNIYEVEEAPYFKNQNKAKDLAQSILLFSGDIKKLAHIYFEEHPFKSKDSNIQKAYIKLLFDEHGIIVKREIRAKDIHLENYLLAFTCTIPIVIPAKVGCKPVALQYMIPISIRAEVSK